MNGHQGLDTATRKYNWLHPDVTTGLVLLAGCALGFWFTTWFPPVPAMLAQNVPPTFFPRLVLVIIAMLAVALIAGSARKPAEVQTRLRPAVCTTAVIMVVAVLLIVPLGALVTMILITLVMPLAWGERRYLTIAGVALTLSSAIYLLFSFALGVRFPGGFLAYLFT